MPRPRTAETLRRTSDLVHARTDEVVDRTMDRLWSNPALARWTLPETRAPSRAIAAASIARELDALRRWELPDTCPAEDLAAAHAAVGYGAPVTVVLQCYRAGHAALWNAWLDAVDALELDPGLRRTVLDLGSEFLFAYVDRCAAWVEDEYALARDRALRAAEQQRMRTVLRVLAGETADAGALGYPLEGRHLGLVAWGAAHDVAVEDVAALLGADAVLAVSPDPNTTWAWLTPRHDRPGALRDHRPPRDTWIAVGGLAAGPDGFRRAHQEARDAQRVARHRPAAVTRYDDVGLEALGLLDEDRARDFVLRELGTLAREGRREETLRTTLVAYFASGHNAASTGARLGVHERTVTNRLRAAEGLLGLSVIARRAELEVALRLRETLELGGISRQSGP